MVPADHPDNNQRMVRETLLSGLNLSEDQIHPIATEGRSAEATAADYDRTLRLGFGLQGIEPPSFDLVLLGLGDDGHTASLLPGCPAVNETHRRVAVCASPTVVHARITVTLPVLNAGREVLFLVSGPTKTIALRRVVESKDPSLPAARVRPTAGHLQFLVDRAAASDLTTGGSP
jgi:6-phosphogluconolactonase